MSVSCLNDLWFHVGHEIEVVTYGDPPANAAIECITCGEVLLDFDKEPGPTEEPEADLFRDADHWTDCPNCGAALGWNEEDGLAGQLCVCGYEFNE